jgi:hypothetical protein
VPVHIPDALEEVLSPAWLNEALAPRLAGTRIVAVEPGEVVSRVSTNVRFHIVCDGALPQDLSPDLCIKGYFAHPAAGYAGVPEVMFYRELAEASSVRTLRCVFAGIDDRTQHGVLITEDAVAAGASFPDGTGPYGPDLAAQSLAELAQFHATWWGNVDKPKAAWLQPRYAGTLRVRGEAEIAGNFDGPIGKGVPPEIRDPGRLVDAYRSVAETVARSQLGTIVHGDPHPANMIIDAAGKPGFVDWQLVQRASWEIDVGYHIAASLPVHDRRAHELDLLRHYLDCLSASGIESPTFDEARQVLHRGIVVGLFLWAITLHVNPAVTTTLLERLGTAASDHNVFEAVRRGT